MSENSYPHIQCTNIPNRFLSLFDRFKTICDTCALRSRRYELSDISGHTVVIRTWIVRKLNIPQFQCTSITNRFLSFFWQLNRLLQLYDLNSQITGISAISVHKYYKSCSQRITKRFLSLFDRFTAYYNCMSFNFRKLVSLRLHCTSITNRVLSFFDRFTAYYNCMTWIVRKLICPWSQCTSITTRFLSLFDRFMIFYNCTTRNVKKLVSQQFQCTSTTNLFFKLIWPFYGLLQLYDLNCQKTHISAISVHKYHKSFS